jgi:hypothetical protein
MNTTKLFLHPVLDGAFIMETEMGNFAITSYGVYKTTEPVSGLTEVNFDISVQGVVSNAKAIAGMQLSEQGIEMLEVLIQEKMEDFD